MEKPKKRKKRFSYKTKEAWTKSVAKGTETTIRLAAERRVIRNRFYDDVFEPATRQAKELGKIKQKDWAVYLNSLNILTMDGKTWTYDRVKGVLRFQRARLGIPKISRPTANSRSLHRSWSQHS